MHKRLTIGYLSRRLFSLVALLVLVLPLLALQAGQTQAAPRPAEIQDYCPGPDGYGYRCCDATYCWLDISTTGTQITDLNDDESVAGPFSIGFSFLFYGTNFTQFFAYSNGLLTVGDTPLGFTYLNECPLPFGMTGTDYQIGIFWDDLDFSISGEAYYQNFATCPVGSPVPCLVVQYSNTAYYGGAPGSAGTWEAILYENGDILMQFLDAGVEEGSSSTTGLDGDWSINQRWGIVYACNTAGSITDGLAVMFGYRSDFACPNDCPLAVRLTSFEAAPAPGGVRISWETASEWDNVGFNLYRSDSREHLGLRLNADLIPSASPGGGQGAAYEFLDTSVPAGVSYYTLEDVDTSGIRTSHGPIELRLWQGHLPLVLRHRCIIRVESGD